MKNNPIETIKKTIEETIKETIEETIEKTIEDKRNKNEEKSVNLDTILLEIGQFGRYQLRTMALLALLSVFVAFATAEYIFTTARIPTRCLIPECENVEGPFEFKPSWIYNAVPVAAGGSFDNCKRFASISWNDTNNIDDMCPITIFDQNTVISCEQYVYDNENTIVYNFDLACDEWRRSIIGSLRAVGNVVALPLMGFISDRWGRRTALTIAAFNTAWLGLVRYWANSYIGFVISEIAEATFGGTFSCCYILIMELVSSKYRVAAAVVLNTSFTIGEIIVGIIAWAVPYWRHLVLAIYIPQLVTISYLWLISESVRWYMSKGRYAESEKVLKKVARVNGTMLSEKSLQALKLSAEEEKRQNEFKKEQKVKEPWLVVIVFHHKAILLRCIVSPIWWVSAMFIRYGLTVNSVNISGNKYVDFCAVAAVDIPGCWAAYILVRSIGRKPVLAGAYWICACCQIAYLIMPGGHYGLSLTIYLIGKCTISMVLTLLYVYTIELFPTVHRHRLFAFSSMVGRLGSIIAPLTPAFGDKLPFILFAGCALLSGGLVLLTPETLGSKLPDTMEEAAQLGKKKTNSC